MKKFYAIVIITLNLFLLLGCVSSIQKKTDEFVKNKGTIENGTITSTISSPNSVDTIYPESFTYGLCKENSRVCFSYDYTTPDGKEFTITS